MQTFYGACCTNTRYVCARLKRGDKKTEKRNLEQNRKIGTKETGCTAVLIVKTYRCIPGLYGYFTGTHNHPLGADNLIYTHLSSRARETIISGILLGESFSPRCTLPGAICPCYCRVDRHSAGCVVMYFGMPLQPILQCQSLPLPGNSSPRLSKI